MWSSRGRQYASTEYGSEKVGQFFLLSSTVIFLINNARHPKFKIKGMIFLLMYIIMCTKSLHILAILVAICQGRSGVVAIAIPAELA